MFGRGIYHNANLNFLLAQQPCIGFIRGLSEEKVKC